MMCRCGLRDWRSSSQRVIQWGVDLVGELPVGDASPAGSVTRETRGLQSEMRRVAVDERNGATVGFVGRRGASNGTV